MTITPILTSAASDAQREAAELRLPSFLRSFEAWRATAEAFEDQDDIDGAALASGIAAIQARAEAGFDAGTDLELQGSRSPGGLPIWRRSCWRPWRRISGLPTTSSRATWRSPAASASREAQAMPRARKSHHVRQDVTRLPAASDARIRAEFRQAQLGHDPLIRLAAECGRQDGAHDALTQTDEQG